MLVAHPGSRPSCLRTLRWIAPALLSLLTACASVGDYGSGYPTRGEPSYPQPAPRQELAGEVQNVDHGNRRFLLQEDRGDRADVAYDDGTRLVYEGREQAVSGLEPGDRIRVLASREGGLWRARDIEVLADARGGGDMGVDQVRGAISFVDPRTRTIGYTEGGYTGGERRVFFDRDTLVEYRGQRYRPDALERGDLVRIQLRRGDNGWIADRIEVEASARDR